ncbi:hypothetical protein [Streptomyces sp. NPDC057302]|uniref:hypothetical protein n=1 Tax=Streptomyces sp. NPDC057302 TaxID=3346094 RepID=UPI00363BC9AE
MSKQFPKKQRELKSNEESSLTFPRKYGESLLRRESTSVSGTPAEAGLAFNETALWWPNEGASFKVETVDERQLGDRFKRLADLSDGKYLSVGGASIPIALTLGSFQVDPVAVTVGAILASASIEFSKSFLQEAARDCFQVVKGRASTSGSDPFARCESILKKKINLPGADAPSWTLESVVFKNSSGSSIHLDKGTSVRGFETLAGLTFDTLPGEFEIHWFSVGAVWLALSCGDAYTWVNGAWVLLTQSHP